MDYHQERFEDFSLMIYKEDKLIALLPANKVGNTLHSHQGLTYGGLITLKETKFEDVLNLFKATLNYLSDELVEYVKLKVLPKVYLHLPNDEIEYLLFKLNANLYRRDISTSIDNFNKLEIKSSNRKRSLKKAQANNIEVREVNEMESFWNKILIPNLKEKHNVLPTHSLKEIVLLKQSFPNQIRQFNAYYNNKIIAGVTIFETKMVAHSQYISTLSSKNNLGGLDAIFNYLIQEVFKHKRYFDFGISNENQGQQINKGLLSWKESFGARAIAHDFYTIKTENYNLLNDVLV
ncbi:GNAT family N-acetyltransferase [Ichthyenterobacterium magnum]|uniref:GNAT family N-acetyltransferase n=1 Tax=Ichthyenterobacterium magnum TaxID=1230530 RepID=UPI001FE8E65F|nr:GNAT family N-acetyltransferase [Ichthyenterobacterium magnum]